FSSRRRHTIFSRDWSSDVCSSDLLFFFIFFLSKRLGQVFGFNRADRITAIFCGSKKSMMQGALMANVMFTGTALAGVILLPIMRSEERRGGKDIRFLGSVSD